MENEYYQNALNLRNQGYSLQQIANRIGVSKTTVFRLLKETIEEEIAPEWDDQIVTLELQVLDIQDQMLNALVKQSEVNVKQSIADEQKAQYLTTKFHKILADVYEQAKIKTWQVSDYEDCVKQIEKLKSQLAYYAFNVLYTDHEELVIWVYLTKLQTKIVRMLSLYKRQIIPFFKPELKQSKADLEEIEQMKQLESVDTLVNSKPR